MPHITRLRIKNYRGIEALDAQIGDKGAIARGANAKGKTSVLRAIRAALAAKDIGADAIRIGAEKAEILVDLDDVTVRRVITASTSSLSVDTSAHDRKRKPQEFLNELLGSAPLDPLDLYLAKPRERRAVVLSALPAKITDVEFYAWIPEWARDLVPAHVRDMLGTLHGIDAISALHKTFYDQRADANAAAKSAKNEAEQLAKQLDEMGDATGAPSTEEAGRSAELARTHLAELDARKRRAEQQEKSVTSARTMIVVARGNAAAQRKSAEGAPSKVEVETARERVVELRKQLDAAIADFDEKRVAEENASLALRRADEFNAQADELERTIGAVTETAPTADDFAAARSDVDAAQAATLRAALAERIREHVAKVERATQSADELAKRAEDLTGIVDHLRVSAPRELLAKCNAIPGLGIDGDTLTLDGKSIDALSGREQMHFAIEVARRANAKTKILVVDRLEALDPDSLSAFIADATRDGYQLIATRVDRGEMVLDAITDEAAEAAE